MPLGTRLSAAEAAKIDAWIEAGKSQVYCADKLKRSRKAVQTYVKNRASYFDPHKNGSKPMLKERQKRAIIRHISKTGDSLNATRHALNLEASKQTIWRVVNSSVALRYVKAKRKPKLLDHHKTARLEFARIHMTWNLEWRSIVFSDEKKFNLDGPDGFQYYWHDLRKEEKVMSKRVHGGASVMVWAAFGFYGKTEIVFRECKGDSSVYTTLLGNHLLPFLQSLGGGNWIFQQDGASIHRSEETLNWLRDHNVEVLQWPALSPDLNPIENLWGILARDVYLNGKRQFNTAADLRKAILQNWSKIPVGSLEDLVLSMPKRLFEVIRGAGASIKY